MKWGFSCNHVLLHRGPPLQGRQSSMKLTPCDGEKILLGGWVNFTRF